MVGLSPDSIGSIILLFSQEKNKNKFELSWNWYCPEIGRGTCTTYTGNVSFEKHHIDSKDH